MSLIGLYPENMRAAVSKDRSEFDAWSWARKTGHRILTETILGASIFDTIMGLLILFNACLLIFETDQRAECGSDSCVPDWVQGVNIVLLLAYIFEAALRLFVQRLAFWASPWNCLDAFIVIAGIIGQVAPQATVQSEKLSLFRLCRLARVVRVARILQGFTTLTTMLRGFAGAARAMICGIGLILVMLLMWSILAVEVINPINQGLNVDKYCKDAFTTVMRTTLYFFQTLVAGDSWGYCTIPIINAEPATYFLFAGALVSVQLGFTNLVLAVIVDKAAESREGSKEEQRVKKLEEEQDSIRTWQETMEALDADKSGTITETELMEGYSNRVVRTTLDSMNISKSDVEKLFKTMDIDDSGSLGYGEFADNFHTAQMQDPRIYMMSVKLIVEKIEHKIEHVVINRINEIAQALSIAEPIPPQHQPLRVASKSPKHSNNVPENFDQVDMEVKQAPRATDIQGGGRGRNKAFQEEAHLHAAPPCPEVFPPFEGCAQAAASAAGDAELAAKLGALQISLEARLDGLVAEAREATACLGQQCALLDRRCSTAAPIASAPSVAGCVGDDACLPLQPSMLAAVGSGGGAITWQGEPCLATSKPLAHQGLPTLAATSAAGTTAVRGGGGRGGLFLAGQEGARGSVCTSGGAEP